MYRNNTLGLTLIPLFSTITGEALLMKALNSAVIARDEKERIVYNQNKLTEKRVTVKPGQDEKERIPE